MSYYECLDALEIPCSCIHCQNDNLKIELNQIEKENIGLWSCIEELYGRVYKAEKASA